MTTICPRRSDASWVVRNRFSPRKTVEKQEYRLERSSIYLAFEEFLSRNRAYIDNYQVLAASMSLKYFQ